MISFIKDKNWQKKKLMIKKTKKKKLERLRRPKNKEKRIKPGEKFYKFYSFATSQDSYNKDLDIGDKCDVPNCGQILTRDKGKHPPYVCQCPKLKIDRPKVNIDWFKNTGQRCLHCLVKVHKTTNYQFNYMKCRRYIVKKNEQQGFCDRAHHIYLYDPNEDGIIVPIPSAPKQWRDTFVSSKDSNQVSSENTNHTSKQTLIDKPKATATPPSTKPLTTSALQHGKKVPSGSTSNKCSKQKSSPQQQSDVSVNNPITSSQTTQLVETGASSSQLPCLVETDATSSQPPHLVETDTNSSQLPHLVENDAISNQPPHLFETDATSSQPATAMLLLNLSLPVHELTRLNHQWWFPIKLCLPRGRTLWLKSQIFINQDLT